MSAPTTRPLADALTLASETQHGVVQLAADGESAAGKAVTGADGRLDNPRDPNPHAASHATAGGDPLAPADIGAAGAVHTHTSADVTDFTEASQDVTGAMVAAAGGTYDDAAGTITLPAGGHEIRDAGTPLTQRAGFNIIVGSSGATLADDAANDQTTFDVSSLTGGGGGGQVALIAATTLASPQATITFTSIPGTYRDLLLIGYGRSVGAVNEDQVLARCNSDSAANYYQQRQGATNTAASIGSLASATALWIGHFAGASSPAGGAGAFQVRVIGYAGTTWQKHSQAHITQQYDAGANSLQIFFVGGLWRSTAAITRLDLTLASGSNFATGTTIALYGWS